MSRPTGTILVADSSAQDEQDASGVHEEMTHGTTGTLGRTYLVYFGRHAVLD